MERETIIVARAARAHGLKGELFLEPSTDHPREVFRPGRVLRLDPPAEGLPHALTVRESRPHKKGWLVLVEEVADRSAAERLRGSWLGVAADDLPELSPGEFFLHDLIDLEVVADTGERVGRVREVLEFPSGPMLVIVQGEREHMIPLHPDLVPQVDLVERRIMVRPPEGLLDL